MALITVNLFIALSEGKDIFRGITLFEKLMAHNNPNVDLVSDNKFTKFSYIYIPSIRSQYFEQNPKFWGNVYKNIMYNVHVIMYIK